MKKTISFTLLLAIVMSFCACGGANPESFTQQTKGTTASSASEAFSASSDPTRAHEPEAVIKQLNLPRIENSVKTVFEIYHLYYNETSVGGVNSIVPKKEPSGGMFDLNQIKRSEVKEPTYLPAGMSVVEADYRATDDDFVTYFGKENDSEENRLYLRQRYAAKDVKITYAPQTRVYTVEYQNVRGVVIESDSESPDGRIKRVERILCFDDGEFFFRLGGYDYEIEELLKTAAGLDLRQPAPDEPTSQTEPSDIERIPAPYKTGYAETVGKYVLSFSDAKIEVLQTVTSGFGTVAEGESVYPLCDGGSILENGNCIYKPEGRAGTVVYTQSSHASSHTVFYTKNDLLFKVNVGKYEGIGYTGAALSSLFWSDGAFDYTLYNDSSSVSLSELQALALSVGSGAKPDAAGSCDYQKAENYRFTIDGYHMSIGIVEKDLGEYLMLTVRFETDCERDAGASLYTGAFRKERSGKNDSVPVHGRSFQTTMIVGKTAFDDYDILRINLNTVIGVLAYLGFSFEKDAGLTLTDEQLVGLTKEEN